MSAAAKAITAPLIIFAIPGSQFVFKVLAALQSRQLEHYVHFVPLDVKKRQKVIPSGGHLVPELQVGSGKDKIVVTDSERILHWLDDHCQTKFFPSPKANELSERASTGTLAAMVWYYNWVDDEGYHRSMRESIGAVLPSFVPWFVVDVVLKSSRAKFRAQVQDTLHLQSTDLDDGPAMKEKLRQELLFFQSQLTTTSNQEFLLEGSSEPTAADFSVYAQVERLVGGDDGGNVVSSDVPIPPAIPDLKHDASLQRLWKWHDHMRATCPVQFKNKRPPKELLN